MARYRTILLGLLLALIVVHIPGYNQLTPHPQGAWDSTFPIQQTTHEEHDAREGGQRREVGFVTSEDSVDGILDPVQVKQSGVRVSENVTGRTDTGTNSMRNLTIDDQNGWFADAATLEVWNIRRLYVSNGTFEDGTSAWSTDFRDPIGTQTQNAEFNSSMEHVSVENIGPLTNIPQQEYSHYAGSWVMWSQTVDNAPFTYNYSLSFSWLYESGPYDPVGNDFLPEIWFGAFLDDIGWIIDLTSWGPRDVWDSISLDVNPDWISDPFVFEIGIYFPYDVDLRATIDYDDDGYADGIDNAESIKVLIDDVSLVGRSVLDSEQVEMMFHAESQTANVTDAGVIDTAQITNPSLWTQGPLTIAITTNASVSLDYRTSLMSHRYVNSSWAADPARPGVSYSVSAGFSGELTFYTYVGSTGEYQNLTIRAILPVDWENATIRNPFLNDVTSQCSVEVGLITIPNSQLYSLGWWEITLQSPNYCKSVSTQKLNFGSGLWSDSSSFGSGNATRVQIEIGTSVETPEIDDPINVTWTMPNGTIWTEDSIVSVLYGAANSSQCVLDGLNTTAGEWSVIVHWVNGTEIALGQAMFDMYHAAALTLAQPQYSTIETDSGLVVTNFLHYMDVDNGDYIMDGSASIVANWSGGQVFFSANLLRNWYEADFDTSLIGNGQFLVLVNASRPYFNNASCQFVVISTYQSDFWLTSVGGVPIEAGLYENISIDARFELEGGPGIDGAAIQMDYSGPSGGLTFLGQSSSGPGDYSINITSSMSGTYMVTLTGSKQYHHNGSDTFTLIVGEIGTALTFANGTADFARLGSTYRLVVRYANSTNQGLIGADVSVVDVTPSAGLSFGNATYVLDGYYSILLDLSSAKTFTLVVKANLTNHETHFSTFTVTVSEIPTVLVLDASTATISADQAHTIQFSLEDDLSNGLQGAQIFALSPPEGLSIHSFLDLTGGLYNITVEAPDTGTYQIAFRAYLKNYQNSTVGFTLIVKYVTMQIIDVQGLTATEGLPTTLSLRVIDSDTGTAVSGATVEFQIVTDLGPGLLEEMVETSPGVYTASITMPSAEGTSSLRVYVTRENHELEGSVFEATFVPIVSELGILTRTLQRLFPFMALAVAAVVGLAGRRVYIRRQRERNLEAIIVKRRFDDVRSLLGVIVLHKHTGIPIFSKMVKGGLDETLVSGFVSAISTFRSEFNVGQEDWVVTPISDIIRTVATQNLICAFISLSAPSRSQELRMVEFAETVGFVFDNMFTEPPVRALDEWTIIQFEALFDDILDGRLLKGYKVAELKGFPRKTKCIEERITKIDGVDGFELEELANEMTSCGFEEARVYKIIMEAIENENLVTTRIKEIRDRAESETSSDSSLSD
ncbi:MAG: hypothetical protein ACFFD9_04845 [Candidatus Thorarchaeota archaeon]